MNVQKKYRGMLRKLVKIILLVTSASGILLICFLQLWFGFAHPERMVSLYKRVADLKMAQVSRNEPILIAEGLTRVSRFEDALHFYNRYLEGKPDSPEVIVKVSELLYKLDRPDEAIVRLSSVLDRWPKTISAGLLLGKIYLAQGELQKAEGIYIRIKDAYPEGQCPVEVLNMLNRFDEFRNRATIKEEFLE